MTTLKALCFSFGRHIAQQAPRYPDSVRFVEWGEICEITSGWV
jgi:hypothetical protein